VPKRVHASEPYDVFIGRPGEWGNLYRVGNGRTRAQVIEAHRKLVERKVSNQPGYLARLLWMMRDKVLGCPGCKTGTPCHGDNYLAIVKRYRKLYKKT
jgi:hypothetical protein